MYKIDLNGPQFVLDSEFDFDVTEEIKEDLKVGLWKEEKEKLVQRNLLAFEQENEDWFNNSEHNSLEGSEKHEKIREMASWKAWEMLVRESECFLDGVFIVVPQSDFRDPGKLPVADEDDGESGSECLGTLTLFGNQESDEESDFDSDSDPLDVFV